MEGPPPSLENGHRSTCPTGSFLTCRAGELLASTSWWELGTRRRTTDTQTPAQDAGTVATAGAPVSPPARLLAWERHPARAPARPRLRCCRRRRGLVSPRASPHLAAPSALPFFQTFWILIPLSPGRLVRLSPLCPKCQSSQRPCWMDGGPKLTTQAPSLTHPHSSDNCTRAGGWETEAHQLKTLPRAQGNV